MRSEEYDPSLIPLFETKIGKRRFLYKMFAVSVFMGIMTIWVYRLNEMPENGEDGRWVWMGLLGSELWFGLYWLLHQSLRSNLLFRQPFRNILSQRYDESRLPEVDIFVCTADAEVEPAMMVIDTVLSVMAYDYPSQKLSVYVSDDAASPITFYALLEASFFAKHWLPYCKTFKVDPTSPSAYFNSTISIATEFVAIENLYDDMKRRIENAAKVGEVPKDGEHSKHKGFSEWDSFSSPRDHHTILQIILHRKELNSKDIDGFVLPNLVYLAREKRPHYPHHFKAGAMNSLLRVSSSISNGKFILNVDCDMYSNNSQSLRDALCFFMDEERGHQIAFVQTPQAFQNVTNNDLYAHAMRVIHQLDLHGIDGHGGPLYIGTGCFHRREALCGRKFNDDEKSSENKSEETTLEENLDELEQKTKPLANCTYEQINTLWGKQMGLLYGCLVEDVITGLAIQCRGWKSVYYNPQRKPFLGLAPTTLPQTLIQHKRWSEGGFQVLLSKYSPAFYAYGKISLDLQMGYCYFNLWALNCFATLYYSLIPSLYLLKGISLFPQMSSPWFVAFAYVIVGESSYSLFEFLWVGGTIQGWWNDLRMWLYKRTSSYLFASMDTIFKSLGFSDSSGFTISAKVAEEEASHRFEREIMEFGTSSPMLTLLATLALLNLFCFLGMIKKVALSEGGVEFCKKMGLQVILNGFLVLINFPIFQGLFLRKDKGSLPTSLAIKSSALALAACVFFTALP